MYDDIFNLQKRVKPGRPFSVHTKSGLCVLCRGTKMLCGKTSCPVVLRYHQNMRVAPLIDTLNLEGSSPPSVFVGRVGYPKVSIGPLIPPVHGDTSILDTPEKWVGKSMNEIVAMRSQLVRGKYSVRVDQVENGGRLVDIVREIAMAKNPAEVDATLFKKPRGGLVLSDAVQPHGPSAPLKSLSVDGLKIDRRIDKAYSDTDLFAKDAVLTLYQNDVSVTRIQRAFSVGSFGLGDNRKFVPTRWSITAVDDTISKHMVERVKDYPWINEYRVYESWSLDNRFIVLMIPAAWSYELVEAWYPNTTWNPDGEEVAIFSSSEGYGGRSKYAEIGGCYYAARLATSEHLEREKRQASIVILREAHPGYIMPVGVWNVRENVREAVRKAPRRFNTMSEALGYVQTRLDIPLSTWVANSWMLRQRLFQRRLDDFT
ncbi:hypothetical protein BMS3Abin16_01328 [archaeon BMS3Abin16]|nr:hypothetical protein BMS3Abin16_01328 [archaeon BMS3Abin16]